MFSPLNIIYGWQRHMRGMGLTIGFILGDQHGNFERDIV